MDIKYGVLPRKKYDFTPSSLSNSIKPDRMPERTDKIDRALGEKPLL